MSVAIQAKLSDFHITLSGGYLSDMFFNHDLNNYNGLDPQDDDEDEIAYAKRVHEALMKDADAFLDCTPLRRDDDRVVLQHVLVEDFLRRV